MKVQDIIKIKEKIEKYEDGKEFILENGVSLYNQDWNGEKYLYGFDENKRIKIDHEYIPVYKFQLEGISIEKLEKYEELEEYKILEKLNEIVGFEEF